MHSLQAIIRARLRSEGHFDLVLQGRCMEPLLLAGDRARVVPVEEPRKGDLVLVLLDEETLALHRIVYLGFETAVTKGDYSSKAEDVRLANLLGAAKEFSLAGGPWVSDPRSECELSGIAALSAALEGENCKGRSRREEVRALVWSLNKAARESMLEEGRGGRNEGPCIQ